MENKPKSSLKNPFRLNLQLRLADTDSLGHINNISYIAYLETARTQWQATVKGTRYAVEGDQWDWILGKITITFQKEARLRDELEIFMWCSRIGNKSWDFSYQIVNQNDEVVLTATTTQIAYNYHTGESTVIPLDIMDDLKLRLE